MAEPGKWELNPHATLGEMARSEDDPGYQGTVCGVHRTLWLLINVDLNGYIPQDYLDRINGLLEKAYKMGKRMDHRLHLYHAEKHGVRTASKEFMAEVKEFPPSDKGKK